MYILLLIHLVFSPVPNVKSVEIVSFHSSKDACFKEIRARRQKIGNGWPRELNIGCVPLNKGGLQ